MALQLFSFSLLFMNSLLTFAISSTKMRFRACIVTSLLLCIDFTIVNANSSLGFHYDDFATERSRKPHSSPAQYTQPHPVLLDRNLDRRQGDSIPKLLKTIGRYNMKIQSAISPMDQIRAKLSLATSLGRREVETKIYPRARDDSLFLREKNELSWMTNELVTANEHALSRLTLKSPQNPVDAARQERIKRSFYKGMASWRANPNKLVEDEKAKHADYAQKIKQAHRKGKHDEAEDLKWYKKRYGQAWGHHYALLKGIDKKTGGKTKATASLPRRPGSLDLPQQERQALERTSSKSSDGIFAEATRDP